MHDTLVVLKTGARLCGPIWEWHPKEGWFTVCDYDVSNMPTRVEFVDVERAVTPGQRLSIESPPEGEDEDVLARARRDGWPGT